MMKVTNGLTFLNCCVQGHEANFSEAPKREFDT